MGLRAQKIETLILAQLESVGQAEVAKTLNVDESTISHLKYPDKVKINFTSIALMLEKLGIKTVPEHFKCVDPEVFHMLWTGHQKYMETIKKPEELLFEDQE